MIQRGVKYHYFKGPVDEINVYKTSQGRLATPQKNKIKQKNI